MQIQYWNIEAHFLMATQQYHSYRKYKNSEKNGNTQNDEIRKDIIIVRIFTTTGKRKQDTDIDWFEWSVNHAPINTDSRTTLASLTWWLDGLRKWFVRAEISLEPRLAQLGPGYQARMGIVGRAAATWEEMRPPLPTPFPACLRWSFVFVRCTSCSPRYYSIVVEKDHDLARGLSPSLVLTPNRRN